MTSRLLPSAIVFVLALSACVIEVPMARSAPVPRPPRALSGTGALDILVVLDNSGSMEEEHEQLARALFRPECPIQGLNAVPQGLQNPAGATLDDLEELCGFAQILAAWDRDFRVGVITTDVNACDNALPSVQGGEGWSRPQRGCLQPVPGTEQKVIARDDLEVAEKFTSMIEAVGLYGSPYERGLDAADLFLGGQTFTPECEGDLALFRRTDADLLLVFITDEDDCSHGDGQRGFDDETQRQCGETPELFTGHDPNGCYDLADQLVPVSAYAERFLAYAGAGHFSMLTLGGAVTTDLNDEDAPHQSAGCWYDPVLERADDTCWPSRGLSSFTGVGGACGEDTASARDGLPCCTADPATRYQEMAALVDGTTRSICAGDYVGAVSRALQ
ncbi:MAG: hypothetical protein HYS27_19055 [Deltaproteobacteria bacterium]|nr:hypothetical protein [Deltaproteobacteria bacterium]